MTDTNSCPLKAAAPTVALRHLHVTNIDPSITESNLTEYLKQFAPEVKVLALLSRNPSSYSSFKVSVPYTEAQGILNRDLA